MHELPTLYQEQIHRTKYSRWIDHESRRETWEETVDRYLGQMVLQAREHGVELWETEILDELREAILTLGIMPSMRAMMTAGKALERDNVAGYNPVAGDTLVLTRERGLVPIRSLEGHHASVLNIDGHWAMAEFRGYGIQATSRVHLRLNSNSRKTVEATSNHRWALEDGRVLSTAELKAGDRIPFVTAPRPATDALDYRLGVIHGLIYGDGTATYSQERLKGYHIRLCGDHADLLPYFKGHRVTYPPSASGDPVVMLYGAFAKTHSLKQLPWEGETDEYLVGFVRGWLAADGSVSANSQVALTVTEEGARFFGLVASRLGYVVQRTMTLPARTNYGERKRAALQLYLSRSSLAAEDFLIERKRANFRSLDSHYVVTHVEPGVETDVYCAEVPDTNTFVLDQGLLTGNCAYLAVNRPQAFDEALYILCCGTGVGFSVERQYVNQLPEVPTLYPSDTTIVVRDSKIGWASALRQLIHLLYSGVIPEWDVSKVRPAGARLKTFGGRASGPGPLIDLFRYVVAAFTAAQGRKLSSIEAHGIMCKVGDIVVVGGVRRSALISLSNPSDDRMRDAKSGQWWDAHPEYALANNSAVWTEKPSMERFIDEWTSLIKSKSGERGIVNRAGMQKLVERNGRRDPNHDFGTNPCCVSGETWLMTDQGPAQIRDLRGVPFRAVVDGKAYAAPRGSWVSGTARTLTIKTTLGQELRLTPEHRLMTPADWVEAGSLAIGDRLVLNDHRSLKGWGSEDSGDHGYLLGAFIGDGNFSRSASSGNYFGQVKVWQSDEGSEAMAARMLAAAKQLPHRGDWGGWGRLARTGYRVMTIGTLPQQYGITPNAKHDLTPLECQSSDFIRGLLAGLFDTDGHVENWQRGNDKGLSIRLGQSNRELLHSAQRMLLRLGIKSRVYGLHPARMAVLPNGDGGVADYPSSASWRLCIGSNDILRFQELIGFTHARKARLVEDALGRPHRRGLYNKPFETDVAEIIWHDDEIEVWDAYVDTVHAFDANGLYAHNSEIILRDREFCNLSEVVVRPEDNLETLFAKVRLATILGTLQSTFTNFRYLSAQWKKNCEEERLLGVSLTGIMDHPVLSSQESDMGLFLGPWDKAIRWSLADVLAELRRVAVETNTEWAEKLGITPSVAVTCVKPSGTVSQLVDAASGIHPRWSQHYIRTNRGAKSDPVAQFLYMHDIPAEDELLHPDTTWVFSYPMKAPEGSITRHDVSALDQLRLWLTYAEHWCEHKPSITVYVRDEEWLEVGAFVYKHFDRMSGVSFLPHSEHSYKQAPYQDITGKEYERLVAEMPESLDWERLPDFESEDTTEGMKELACTAGSCEVL